MTKLSFYTLWVGDHKNKEEQHMKIHQSIYNDIIEHAKSELPNEGCGYVAGHENELTTFYPMTNTDKSPVHFTFDPKEQFTTMKDARKKGILLKAVYHSHPETPARLSAEDIKELNDPNTLYIIVSLANNSPDMKAYWLKKPDEATIEIKQEKLEIITT